MQQVGHVVFSDKDSAVLDVRRVTACGDKWGSCKSGCSVPGTRIKVKNVLGAKLGDYVEVKTKTSFILKSAFIVYIIPLIILVLGIVTGINISKSLGLPNHESIGLLIGLISLGVSFVILRVYDSKLNKDNKMKIEIVRILEND